MVEYLVGWRRYIYYSLKGIFYVRHDLRVVVGTIESIVGYFMGYVAVKIE